MLVPSRKPAEKEQREDCEKSVTQQVGVRKEVS